MYKKSGKSTLELEDHSPAELAAPVSLCASPSVPLLTPRRSGILWRLQLRAYRELLLLSLFADGQLSTGLEVATLLVPSRSTIPYEVGTFNL